MPVMALFFFSFFWDGWELRIAIDVWRITSFTLLIWYYSLSFIHCIGIPSYVYPTLVRKVFDYYYYFLCSRYNWETVIVHCDDWTLLWLLLLGARMVSPPLPPRKKNNQNVVQYCTCFFLPFVYVFTHQRWNWWRRTGTDCLFLCTSCDSSPVSVFLLSSSWPQQTTTSVFPPFWFGSFFMYSISQYISFSFWCVFWSVEVWREKKNLPQKRTTMTNSKQQLWVSTPLFFANTFVLADAYTPRSKKKNTIKKYP